MHYRAFLSYSHADEKWARWLMRRLESYRVPKSLVGTPGRDGPIPAKLGQVFRDRDELPSAGDLGSTIQAALAHSKALVVISSPAAAQSRWVNAEIQAYRALHGNDTVFSFITDGDPGSREPGIASFPPALVEPEIEGGPEREPLAADARKQGDGRERAFLKLVAGLLGVGFDSLAQREAQHRHRRMAFVTAASLAGMAIAVSLAVTAYIARNDAQRRQAQAEDILGFMLGDLRKNLTKVGRLDLMRSVDDKATGYFATLNPRDLSDRTLEEQARSLTGIGEVRLNEGNHNNAIQAFQEAHLRTLALYERDPSNGQRLFDLSQAQFWIGFSAMQQGKHEDALVWMKKYRDSAVKLAAMDRNNFDWQREAAYGYHNMAVMDHRLGRYASAEQAMLAEKALYEQWLPLHPKDYDLRYEAANVDSFLGSLALLQGRLKDAENYFNAQAQAIQYNLEADSGNAKWKEIRMDAYLLLVDVVSMQGRRAEANRLAAEALLLAKSLHALDASNIIWSTSLGQCYFRMADTALTKAEAIKHLELSEQFLRESHSKDAKSEYYARWLTKVLVAKAELALERGDNLSAERAIREAEQVVIPFWKVEQNENLRIVLAELYLVMGRIASENALSESAREKWSASLALLSEGGLEAPPFARLPMLVATFRLLGRPAEVAKYQKVLRDAGQMESEE